MKSLSNSEIINKIKLEDKKVLLDIYHTYFPGIRHYILSNTGNIYDAEDVFQDAMVIIFMKVRKNKLILTSTLGTYLFSISKFIWYKELRRRRFLNEDLFFDEVPDVETDIVGDYITMEKRKIILDHFNELSQECRKVLELYLSRTSIREMTELLSYSSEQYTMNRRYSCKNRLIKSIRNNPKYKELRNETSRQAAEVPKW